MARQPKKPAAMPVPKFAAQPEEDAPEVPVFPDDEAPEEVAPVAPVVKKAAPAPKKLTFPRMVEALRDGFYQQHRRKEGEKFMCDKEEHLGCWMKVL